MIASQSCLTILSDERAWVRGPKEMERNCDDSFCTASIYLSLATFPIFPRQPFPDILSIQVLPLELAPYPSPDLRSGESEPRLPPNPGMTSDPAGLWDVRQLHWGHWEREECALSWWTWIKANRTKEGNQQRGPKPVLFALLAVELGFLTRQPRQCEGTLCG